MGILGPIRIARDLRSQRVDPVAAAIARARREGALVDQAPRRGHGITSEKASGKSRRGETFCKKRLEN
jgi:hypothetical protein